MEELTVNENSYRVLGLLGKGKGGYSYLVTDGEGEYVLKQIHHEPCSYYTFGDKLASELRDYETLRSLGIPMPKLLAVDKSRERILKTYIPGDTAEKLISRDALDPKYLLQLRGMCEKLCAAGLNIDYYPTNFVPWEGILYYIDYECNPYMEQWGFDHWGRKYWSKTEDFLKAFPE